MYPVDLLRGFDTAGFALLIVTLTAACSPSTLRLSETGRYPSRRTVTCRSFPEGRRRWSGVFPRRRPVASSTSAPEGALVTVTKVTCGAGCTGGCTVAAGGTATTEEAAGATMEDRGTEGVPRTIGTCKGARST